MHIKLYQYHIRPENEQELLLIQQKAGQIYRKYIDVHTKMLKNMIDETKWTEISFFKSVEDYQNKLPLINSNPDIQELYRRFESLLISDIVEEDYEDWL
ncbi:hypothetical protein DFO70_106191 [Cytobacillus firmus]|uniref:Uncharacterized protein n=2 Tax=Cytobacillus TaxID=2675230 RepID=A0A366JWD4_CYTFI|nr:MULTISPECIES: hypothetical protein [Cytobacillus]RBP93060.1 hypothetical protein DFO70_106191 [Cytobacillus firmus]TDX42662.1 hypothetical protein DFO72_106191 [Cytobacillus oceanisediminis]